MRNFIRLADRAILRVAGEGSAKFLQGLCTQDVSSLIPASRTCAAPAAFLSARGRVLCDVIIVASEPQEFLIDCHGGVATSLMRLMIRHRLREPLAIDDVSATHKVVASILPASEATPSEVSDRSGGPSGLPDGFFEDPRFAALGHRGVLDAKAADSLAAADAEVLRQYHYWRMCCGVPEGPLDLPADSALPLHANLDILNFISFSKGCYIGQELTARTKHRGAVRKRFFTVVASEGDDPQAFLDRLQLAPEMPLSAAACIEVAGASEGTRLPGVQVLPTSSGSGDMASEEARAVIALRPGATDWKSCGLLHSVVDNVGLCLLRCDASLNHPESFRDEVALPEGTKLATASGMPLGLRAPPYAFVE